MGLHLRSKGTAYGKSRGQCTPAASDRPTRSIPFRRPAIHIAWAQLNKRGHDIIMHMRGLGRRDDIVHFGIGIEEGDILRPDDS